VKFWEILGNLGVAQVTAVEAAAALVDVKEDAVSLGTVSREEGPLLVILLSVV
jgi:hypothetical protein